MPDRISLRTASLLLWLAVAAAPDLRAQDAPSDMQFLSSPETAKLGLPFSEAVRVGDLLFLSGVVGVEPGTFKLVPGGLEAETRQVLENIRRVLEENGSSMDRVAKCTVMLADIADWPKVNAIYTTYFSKPYPARSALAASGLALGARVEIECIGVASEKP